MLTIQQLISLSPDETLSGQLAVQVRSIVQKFTRDGSLYYEMVLADSDGDLTLRVWNNHPQFERIGTLNQGVFICIDGEFYRNGNYGIDARRWEFSLLEEEAIDALLGGSEAMQARQKADYAFIVHAVEAIGDPRLHTLGHLFLEKFGERFRRTAAARHNHHARRGGLVEHVAQMMRSGIALTTAYQELNKDLLITGILFHDCGKLWENAYPERGFTMPYQETGEMLGHIIIGIEIVNKLWREMMESDNAASWQGLQPDHETVRLHLLHLLAAHHGQLDFGSPVVPKTPEATALHYIDNLDARLEMFRVGYRQATPLAAHVFERVWPLPGNLVTPLPKYHHPQSEISENNEETKE